MSEKGDDSQPKSEWIKWFKDLNKDSGNIAGGKGANLGEISHLDVPVPPGFVVTAQAYQEFIKSNDIDNKIKELLGMIDYENTSQLDEKTKEIRKLITESKFPKDMEEDILESYENLDVGEFDVERGSALDILKTSKEPIFVAVRSSATTEDLAEASFAGQQDSFLNVKGKTELLKHIKKCFASLFTSRATYYRNKKGFKHEQASLAAVVQKMINSDKSGVIFSKNPTSGKEEVLMEAVWGLGEGIVSGRITPDTYIIDERLEIKGKTIANKKVAITRDSSGSKAIVKLREEKAKHQVLKNHEIRKLAEISLKLEEHYQKPQDVEFAIEDEEIFIVQTRPITTIKKDSGSTLGGGELKGKAILTGLAASPGIGVGKIKIIETMSDLPKIKKGDVLVTKMTNPDMVVAMQKSTAIVTDEGGLTSHAAIVSREMGIPAIVGTGEATTKLKENEVITVDGFNGKVYKGKVAETQHKEILPVEAETKTKIKVIVDLPSFAERASKSKINSVGLTRIEGIIAESGKHPQFYLKQNKIQDYEEVIYGGISGIAKHFEEMWVRTSDIRSDEYQNLEGTPQEPEANPMMGNHGIRYSLKNPEIFKAELRALKRVSEGGKKIGVMVPLVISPEEVKKAKEYIKEVGFTNAKMGVMIETPAAVQRIKDICDIGIDFISFGTNDLTQFMLALDRGNEEIQELYDETNLAVLYQLEFVIRVCKRNNVETSICGQAGSKKPMAKFLVEKGIDSISVNADVAAELSQYIKEVEEGLIKGTDKEPRQYQPESEKSNKENKKEEIPENESINAKGNDKIEQGNDPSNELTKSGEIEKIEGGDEPEERVEDLSGLEKDLENEPLEKVSKEEEKPEKIEEESTEEEIENLEDLEEDEDDPYYIQDLSVPSPEDDEDEVLDIF